MERAEFQHHITSIDLAGRYPGFTAIQYTPRVTPGTLDDFRARLKAEHNLGLGVVAEGVENQQTWDRLDELGCDAAQGYFLSPPLPARDFPHWLQHPRVPARKAGIKATDFF